MSLIIGFSRYLLPLIALTVLIKCMLSLVLGHPKEKTYGYIIDMLDGETYPLNMWETSIGRSNSCDIVLGYDTVSRFQAVISRRIDTWYIYDLISKAGIKVNDEQIIKKATVKSGDVLNFGGASFRFMVADDPVARVGRNKKRKGRKAPAPSFKRDTVDFGNDFFDMHKDKSDVQNNPYGNGGTQPNYASQQPCGTQQYETADSHYKAQPFFEQQQGYTAHSDEESIFTKEERQFFYSENNKPNLNFEKPLDSSFTVTKESETQYTYVHDSIFSQREKVTVETAEKAGEGENYIYAGSQPTVINRDTGEKFILCGNIVSVGRGRNNDIKLSSEYVSRHHADLVLYEDGWAITAVPSAAETTLNGVKITEPQLLFEGDVIGLADERLYYTARADRR